MNCLFGAKNIVKNCDEEKYAYCGYGITFDSAGTWSFDNDIARNVMIFVVDNSTSSHSDNRKKVQLTLLMEVLDHQWRSLIHFVTLECW